MRRDGGQEARHPSLLQHPPCLPCNPEASPSPLRATFSPPGGPAGEGGSQTLFPCRIPGEGCCEGPGTSGLELPPDLPLAPRPPSRCGSFRLHHPPCFKMHRAKNGFQVSEAFLQRTLSRVNFNYTKKYGTTVQKPAVQRAFCPTCALYPEGRVTGPPSFWWLLLSCTPGLHPSQVLPSRPTLGCILRSRVPRMWEVTVPSVGAGGCSEGGSGAGHCPCPAGDWGREDASHGTTQAEPRQGTDWSLVGSELPATRGMQAEALVGLLSRVPGRC